MTNNWGWAILHKITQRRQQYGEKNHKTEERGERKHHAPTPNRETKKKKENTHHKSSNEKRRLRNITWNRHYHYNIVSIDISRLLTTVKHWTNLFDTGITSPQWPACDLDSLFQIRWLMPTFSEMEYPKTTNFRKIVNLIRPNWTKIRMIEYINTNLHNQLVNANINSTTTNSGKTAGPVTTNFLNIFAH